MLGRVRKSLGRNEVRRHLDRLLEPHIGRDVEIDGNRGTVRERLQRRAKTALGQDRRMDPTRDLLQILDRRYQSRRDAASSDLLSAFATAVATSSVNLSSRSSVSAGSSSLLETITAPQRRPSTMIGPETVETTPRRASMSARGGDLSRSLSLTRTERPD